MKWLYRYEAKGIQGYILASEKLIEMAGASALVEQLGERAVERARAAGGTEVMVAAGSGTFLFDDDNALTRFADDWPWEVEEHAPGLLVLQAWTPFDGDFPAALKRVLATLEARRNQPRVTLPDAGPFVARAARTGRPAVTRRDGVLCDAATLKKAEQSGGAFHGRMRGIFGVDGARFATDLNAWGEGYLAVIHVDGNGVGKKIIADVSTRDAERQRSFSKGLSEATEHAARTAFDAIRAGLPARGDLPFRPLVVGGDDLTVIARGEDALAFTSAYLDAFEHETKTRPDVGALTAAAGICFVRLGHPFHAAHAIAEDLCKAAKRDVSGASALRFLRVTSAHAASLAALRHDELEFDRGALSAAERAVAAEQPDRRFVGSFEVPPWTHERRAVLADLCRALGGMPRGALREWLRLARVDVERAGAHWDRTLDVMRNGEAFRRSAAGALTEALRRLNGDIGGPFDAQGRTPLLDAATWMAFDRSTR